MVAGRVVHCCSQKESLVPGKEHQGTHGGLCVLEELSSEQLKDVFVFGENKPVLQRTPQPGKGGVTRGRTSL